MRSRAGVVKYIVIAENIARSEKNGVNITDERCFFVRLQKSPNAEERRKKVEALKVRTFFSKFLDNEN